MTSIRCIQLGDNAAALTIHNVFLERAIAPAYPKAYIIAARYNPSASVATAWTLSRQTSRPDEELRARKSGQQLHVNGEDIYVPGQDRRAHYRSSSCPPPLHSFHPSPSQSPWKPTLKMDDSSTSQDQFSFALPPPANPPARPRHFSFEAPSSGFSKQEHHGKKAS